MANSSFSKQKPHKHGLGSSLALQTDGSRFDPSLERFFFVHALREWAWPTWMTFTEYCNNCYLDAYMHCKPIVCSSCLMIALSGQFFLLSVVLS